MQVSWVKEGNLRDVARELHLPTRAEHHTIAGKMFINKSTIHISYEELGGSWGTFGSSWRPFTSEFKPVRTFENISFTVQFLRQFNLTWKRSCFKIKNFNSTEQSWINPG